MDILKRMNAAIAYIEAHLLDGFDPDELARITLYTSDGFNRFFSYAAGMTLKEYIRRRRLTLAAYDLRASGEKVIDVALKYGYEARIPLRGPFSASTAYRRARRDARAHRFGCIRPSPFTF